MKITNPKDFKKMEKVGLPKLFKWMLRVARDVEQFSEGNISPAANDVLERCINGEKVSDKELKLIYEQTYYGNPGGWANYCSSTFSQIMLDLRNPNMVRNNSNVYVPFKGPHGMGADTVKTWEQYVIYHFTYALSWAITAHVNAVFARPLKDQPDRNPEKYRLEITNRYLGWLNEQA